MSAHRLRTDCEFLPRIFIGNDATKFQTNGDGNVPWVRAKKKGDGVGESDERSKLTRTPRTILDLTLLSLLSGFSENNYTACIWRHRPIQIAFPLSRYVY